MRDAALTIEPLRKRPLGGHADTLVIFKVAEIHICVDSAKLSKHYPRSVYYACVGALHSPWRRKSFAAR